MKVASHPRVLGKAPNGGLHLLHGQRLPLGYREVEVEQDGAQREDFGKERLLTCIGLDCFQQNISSPLTDRLLARECFALGVFRAL